MPTHNVSLLIPRAIEVQNTDIELEVLSDGTKLGTLKISKGSFDWYPAGHSANYVSMQWEEFAELMKAQL